MLKSRSVVCIAALLAASAPAAAQPKPPPKAPAIAQTCVACHGLKGVSTTKDTPSLAGQPDIFTQYQEGGPDYIYSLLTGYDEEVPANIELAEGTHYNPYFAGAAALAMAKPISDDQVTYDDGSPQTVDQYAHDVAAFLMWAAEPHLEARKELGFKAMIFLIVFGSLLGFVKRKVWADVH